MRYAMAAMQQHLIAGIHLSAGGADAVFITVLIARILFRCAGWMSLQETPKWQEDSMPLPFRWSILLRWYRMMTLCSTARIALLELIQNISASATCWDWLNGLLRC